MTGDSEASGAAFFWNSAAGLLNALQSFIVLVAVTRLCGLEEAGIYTIAYATANLFLYLGNYGMRQYQASDLSRTAAFPDYLASRTATCLLMLAACGAYLLCSWAGGYGQGKLLAVSVMCLHKAVEALEDVFHGEYQRAGRLDVAARLLAARLLATITLTCWLLHAFGELNPALLGGLACSAAFLCLEPPYVRRRYGIPPAGEMRLGDPRALLRACFPLCAASFLLFYVGNAPRWAIDAAMGEEAQAVFGYIMMPNFVAVLLAGFIFNPLIGRLSALWRDGRYGRFFSDIARLAALAAAMSAAIAAAAWLVGIPALEWLFAVDLANHRGDLVVLMAGGGFLSLLSLGALALTICRLQRFLVPAYACAAAAAFALSGPAVAVAGITGACWLYSTVLGALALAVALCFVVKTRPQRRSATQ